MMRHGGKSSSFSPAGPSDMPARRLTRLLIRTGLTAPGWALLLVAGMCLTTGASLLVPVSLGTVTNAVIAHRDAGPATGWLAAILIAGALGSLAAGVAEPASVACGTAWLSHRLLRHTIALGERGLAGFPPGDITSRLLDNVPAAANAGPSALQIAFSMVASLGAVVALWLTDWLLGVVFLLAAGPAIMVARASVRAVPEVFLRYARAQGRIAAGLSEALNGIRTIASSGTVSLEVDRILRPLPELAAAGRAAWRVQQRMAWRASLCFALMQLAVLATAGWQVAAGELSPGAWLTAAGYTTLALGVFGSIDALLGIAHSRAAAVRVAEILDIPPAGRGTGTVRLGRGAGHLEFRRVTVRSEGHLVLDEVDLDIPAGVTAAVVGASGSGKTTLAALAGRLAEPDEGEILLDRTAVSALRPAELRRGVAYAFARPAGLGQTVADDIGYGSPLIARADIERAARLARAHDFISRLPEGYDTPMAETPLSGGERQRLGIARAIAADARVLVLDDATSSLDTATEAQVNSAIRALRAGRTTLIVAHRASTAARADVVVWLHEGRVRALAPHGRLWLDPAYRAIFGEAALDGRR
jgi:ATP-binding cassette, subfamily B, bacterial RamA/AmfB